MRKNRKSTFQEKRIYALEQKVKELEIAKKTLSQECDRYRNMIAIKNASFEELKHSVDQIKLKFQDNIEQIQKLKEQYLDVISSAQTAKEKYTNEIQILLNQIRNSS